MIWDWIVAHWNISVKGLSWSLFVLIFLILSGIAQFNASKEDSDKNDSIEKNTKTLIDTANATISNLNDISNKAKEAQEAAEKAYNQLDSTYKNTLLGLEKVDENNKAIIKNLKSTLKAKDEILESQGKMISKLTGGNSYPYITFLGNKLQLHLDGDYGIPDLRIEIVFLKNYFKLDYQICEKYINEGFYNNEIIKFYDHTFTKLYVNKRYQNIIIPNDILDCLINDPYAGFDIKYNSGYKSWTQCIRLHKYGFNTDKIEIFSILYESKEKKAVYPEDLVKTLKVQASPNYKDFYNDFKKASGLEKYLDYLVMFYPIIEKKDFKEKDVDQTLAPLNSRQFILRN